MSNPNQSIRLNAAARLDLSAWKLCLDQYNGISLCLSDSWLSSDCITLYLDASLHGFAAIFGKRWLQGCFPCNCANMNIAVKELLPIVLAMQLWGSLMANSRILFICDNMSIVAVINSHTSKYAHIMRLLRQLVVATMLHNIHFASKHIPCKRNSTADALSRFQYDVARRGVSGSTPSRITSLHICCPGDKCRKKHCCFPCTPILITVFILYLLRCTR